tara:strand:+ start:428 stop:715 length:288 start_codon:yes stop_codon:yes gene_type:complete
MNNYTKESIVRLISAAKKSVDILIEEIERELDREELQDDKARNAVKAKRECFEDAQKIIADISKLEAQLNGEEIDSGDNVYSAGFAERFANKKEQ